MKAKQNENHTQCKLVKGNLTQTSWIPQKYAKKGKIISLKDDNGVWDDGWQVAETWTTKPTKYIMEHERDYLTQREFSDI